MAFNVDEKKRIKDSMDYDSGGHLSAIANKAATLDAPILIIGLGGSGADAVLKTKRMIYERLQCEQEGGKTKDKPANIEYLVLDTDENNRNISIQGIGFNRAREECFIVTAPSVQKILNNNLPNYIAPWINKEITQEQVINGAGGVRQLGRLMLFLNLHSILPALEAKIRRVTAGYPSSTPLYVFIVSGISGGTGSGTFLDMPYIIKGKSGQIDSSRPVNTIGLLFLPDVNLSQPGLKDTKKENIRRNGFAALKELDYLMNLEKAGEQFSQEYGNLKVGFAGNDAGAPFTVCILMSAKDKKGVTISNGYQYTLNVAAETIVNFIASEDVKRFEDYSINSFISNEVDERETFTQLMQENRRPVNYVYSIAGASTAKLPMDDLMSYMTYLAFKEVDAFWNRMPSESEVEELAEQLGIEETEMEQRLCEGSPGRSNMERHTYELIRQNPNLVTQDYENVLEQQKIYLDAKLQQLMKEMEDRVTDPNNAVNEIFRDLNRGPIVAQRLLFTYSDRMCLTKRIKNIQNHFLGNRPSALELESLQEIANLKLNELLNAKPLLPGTKQRLRENFMKACDEYFDAQYKAYAYETLGDLCTHYYNCIMDINGEVYDSVADLLGTLVELFKKYANIRTKKDEIQREGGGKTLTWSLIDTPTFIRELEKRMGKNDELYVDLHSFVTSFYSYLFENREIWTGREKTDIVENINRFISQEFESILDKSMDYYIEFIARTQGKSLTQYCDELFRELNARANIMFPIEGAYYTTIEQPGYSIVSVPDNAASVKKSIKEHVRERSIVKESGIKESIYMMNFESAVPLNAYADMPSCHDSYARLLASSPGLHLYESKNRDWRELPSPYPETEWLAGHYIGKEAEENRGWKNIFDRAKEFGYVVWEEDKRRYVCKWGNPVNPDAILAAASVTLDAEMNDFTSVNNCSARIQRALKDMSRLTQNREIYDNKVIIVGEKVVPDDEYAKALFIKMVKVRGEIKRMVEDHERCLDILGNLGKYRRMDELMTSYIMLQYTGTLMKQRGAYIYRDKKDTVRNFTALSGKKNNYPDYYLFQHFAGMAEKDQKELIDSCERNFEEKQKTDEEFEKMRRRLEDFILRISGTVQKLQEEWEGISFDDGRVLLQFYQELEESAAAEMNKF